MENVSHNTSWSANDNDKLNDGQYDESDEQNE